ncbi:UNVERIFIED_CONTAM: hypothetical protein PYX00_002171 [Menopon gallinae]|uniref:aralkylamine N-acetyltransferase n=1 Tax=Menopon gallinae TaxID=328185 RepID=A0AAW2IFD8_9NEOP
MGDIVYSEIHPEHYADVIRHLRYNFFADEPLNKSVSLCKPGEAHEELEQFSLDVLKEGMSFMATLEDTGEVVGVILNGVKGDQGNKENQKTYNDKKLQKIFDFLGNSDNDLDIYTKYNIADVLEVKILSVDMKYRGRGIASKLFEITEKFAGLKKFKLLRADATALFSQKVFQRFGFTTLKEIVYNEYPNKDEPCFTVEPPHVSFKIMVKSLF